MSELYQSLTLLSSWIDLNNIPPFLQKLPLINALRQCEACSGCRLLKQSFLQHIHFQWLHRIWRNRLEHRKYSRTFFNGPLWRVRVCERSVVFVLRENWVRLSRFFAHASPLRVVVKIAWAAFSLVLFKSLKWAPSMVNGHWRIFSCWLLFLYNVLSWRFSIVLSSSWKNSVLLRRAKKLHRPTPHTMFCKTKINQLFTMGNGSTW